MVKVGDKVTIIYYTDREPATVTKVSPSGNKVTVRTNKASCKEPYSQDWEITDDLYGEDKVFYFSKNRKSYCSKGDGCRLNLGAHYKYFDYSF